MKIIFFLIFFFQITVFCQEKRLALVIGNSDYEKAVLNNPVNDALLMRETLEKLNFEVILDTNLRTRNDLLNSINLFGEKRKNYSIGLVYYAGHGVQINGENYLLATNEKYESKINVEDNGVNVGRLLDFFELAKNEINILILDACRNNPFEKNWISKSRSMDDGLGLAPLSSSGNIIAFSTSAGRTATDGTENSKNSPYCLSLVRNMMTPDFDLDQIFRNVRKEVREVSGGNQLPTVDNHYEGSEFYFIKSTYIDQINQIDSLIDINDYDLALEKVTFILIKSPNNKQGLLRRGRIEYMKKNKDYDGFHLYKADSLYPKDSQVLEYLGRYYATIGDIEKAIESIDLAMKIDNANPQLFYWKARFYEEKNEIEKAEIEYTQSIMLESSVNRFVDRADFFYRFNKYILAISDYTKAIELDKENPQWYGQRANCYIAIEDYTSSLKDLDKAIDLAPKDAFYFNNRADFYREYKQEDDLALKDYATAIKLSSDSYQTTRVLNNSALIFEKREQYDLAIEQYTKAIELTPMDALLYSNRADVYKNQKKYELALADYTKSIELDKENPQWFEQRANCYLATEDYTSSLKDLDKAIDLAPKDAFYYNNRADFYREYKQEDDLALKDYETAIKLSSDSYESTRALNNRAIIFEKQEQYDLAIVDYTVAIELTPMESLYYSNRANVYKNQKKYELALADYTKAIELDKENPKLYEQRANCYVAMEDYTSSLKDLDKAIDLAPNEPYYFNNRADFYWEYKKDNDSALKDYATAIKLSSDTYQTTRALNNRALIFVEQEQYDLATVEYTAAIELTPMDALLYSNRADVYKNQKKYTLAQVDYSKSIELDKDNPQWYARRANCYVAMEDYTSSLKDLDKAIDLATKDAFYYNNRADFYREFKQEYNLALKDYATAIKLSSDTYQTTRALNNRALIFVEQEQYDLAIEQYTKAIELTPMESLHYSNRANVYKNQKKYALAQADYSKSIELDKENPQWYAQRANCYVAMEDYTSSLKDLDKAINLAPKDAFYFNNRADFYWEYKKDNDSALKDYATAIKLSSDSDQTTTALNNRALIFQEQKQYDLAIVEYTAAIELDPMDALLYSNRANVYKYQKKYALAQADYTHAINLDKKNPEKYLNRAEFYNDCLNKPYDALVDYSLAIVLDSESIYNWFSRGLHFSNHLNDHQSAIYDFKNILKLDSNNATVLNWIGVFYGRLLDDKNEVFYYLKTISKEGVKFDDSLDMQKNGFSYAYQNLAEIYQTSEQEKALDFYNKAIKYDSDNPEKYYHRAWFFALYLQKNNEAIKDLDKSINLDKTNPQWYLNRAKIHLLANKIDNAKYDFDEAVKMSNNTPTHVAERANYYSIIGENKKADKDFDLAMVNDSIIPLVFHLKTEHLIRQKKLNDAMENALNSIKKFVNDTVSYEQIARIYFEKKEYLKALKAYQTIVAIMDFNKAYRTIEPGVRQVYLSDIHIKIADIYEILKDKILRCNSLEEALINLKYETRPDRQTIIKLIEEEIKYCQN